MSDITAPDRFSFNQKRLAMPKIFPPSSFIPSAMRRSKRAGIVPVCVDDFGILRFGLGRAGRSLCIKDFGGRFEPHIDTDVIDNAIREVREETFGIVNLSRSYVQNYSVVLSVGETDTLFFTPIHYKTVHMIAMASQFDKMVGEIGREECEMVEMVWWTTDEILANRDQLIRRFRFELFWEHNRHTGAPISTLQLITRYMSELLVQA